MPQTYLAAAHQGAKTRYFPSPTSSKPPKETCPKRLAMILCTALQAQRSAKSQTRIKKYHCLKQNARKTATTTNPTARTQSQDPVRSRQAHARANNPHRASPAVIQAASARTQPRHHAGSSEAASAAGAGFSGGGLWRLWRLAGSLGGGGFGVAAGVAADLRLDSVAISFHLRQPSKSISACMQPHSLTLRSNHTKLTGCAAGVSGNAETAKGSWDTYLGEEVVAARRQRFVPVRLQVACRERDDDDWALEEARLVGELVLAPDRLVGRRRRQVLVGRELLIFAGVIVAQARVQHRRRAAR